MSNDLVMEWRDISTAPMTGALFRVECGGCGWTGRRKPGNVVECPRCGGFASYQEDSK